MARGNVLQRGHILLFCFEYISEPVLSYLHLSKEVEFTSLFFFFFFYTSINTSTWIKNVCMFATSGKLWCKPARASRACDIQYQQLTVSHSTQGCLSEPFACLISLSRMPRDTCFYCLAAHEGNNTKETVRCPLCIRLWNKCWMGPLSLLQNRLAASYVLKLMCFLFRSFESW